MPLTSTLRHEQLLLFKQQLGWVRTVFFLFRLQSLSKTEIQKFLYCQLKFILTPLVQTLPSLYTIDYQYIQTYLLGLEDRSRTPRVHTLFPRFTEQHITLCFPFPPLKIFFTQQFQLFHSQFLIPGFKVDFDFADLPSLSFQVLRNVHHYRSDSYNPF